MKKRDAPAMLVALLMFGFTGCVSQPHQEIMVEGPDASSQGGSPSPVPGEKVSDDGRVTPGAPGSNASVHW